MKSNRNVSFVTAVLILILITTYPLKVNAGGYFITDKDGNIISEGSEKTIVIGPTDKTIVLNDDNGTKAFNLTWDAHERALLISGDHVDVKIHSSGKIEKWSTFEDSGQEQYPIFIEPIIPIIPRH
jgi:hypothetical protein